MKLDLLAIAAHPDDVELTCGGTLLKMARRGYKTGILDLTAGEMGTRGTPETRAKEAAKAAKILGVAWRGTLGLPASDVHPVPPRKPAGEGQVFWAYGTRARGNNHAGASVWRDGRGEIGRPVADKGFAAGRGRGSDGCPLSLVFGEGGGFPCLPRLPQAGGPPL